MTDSATGGYLSPSSTPPLSDEDLVDHLQSVVVGITGLPGNMVRPRWQETPPAHPKVSEDWCALGIIRVDAEQYGGLVHNPQGAGTSTLYRNQQIEILASFYGPNRFGFAGLLSDGLLIPQNWEASKSAGIAFLEAWSVVGTAELVNSNWVRRADLRWLVSRRTARTYPIRNVLSAHGSLATPAASQNFDTEN